MWTKKGQLYIILGCLLLFIGLYFNNLVCMLIGFLLISMVVISSIIRLLNEITYFRKGMSEEEKHTYKGLNFTRSLSSDQITENSNVNVELKIENTKKIPRRFELLDMAPDTTALAIGYNSSILTLPAKEDTILDYQLTCPVKGYYELGPIKLRETDIGQFFYKEKSLDIKTDFKVIPNTFEIKELKVKSKIPKLYAGSTIINKPGQGTEFYSVRDYVPGDPYRDINWPAYARTKKLMVDEHEMEAVIELTIILDYRNTSKTGKVINNPHLASARAAASLATYFIKRRDKVGLILFNDKVTQIHCEGGAKHLNRLIDNITGSEVKGEIPIAAVINSVIHNVRKGMPVVVISNLEGDESAYEGLKRLRALGCNVILISPSGLDNEIDSGKEKEEINILKLLKIQHQIFLNKINSLGVKVVDWNINQPLSHVIAASLLSPNIGRTLV